MLFVRSLAGYYVVEIICASPPDMLTYVNNIGVHLFHVIFVDDFTVRASVYKLDFKMLHDCIQNRGEKLIVIQKKGLYWTGINFLKRPVLSFGLLIILFLVLYLPTRILFVRVEGNQTVLSKQIIEKAENCGIYFGALRRDIRSEKIKNALLSDIPELQWVGVNSSGCVATISVRERSKPDKNLQINNICSIVANHDGIIKELTVLRGSALCKVGQAVKKGQVLVSGYEDCGIYIKGVKANAEIFAQTLRNFNAVSPASYLKRCDSFKEETRCSIKIGKKLIKLYKDSGIPDARCVKIYNESYLTLPGGYQLPVAMIFENIYYCESETKIATDVNESAWLEEACKKTLYESMVAGEILDSTITVNLYEQFYNLHGQYFCLEMIGQVRNEGIVQNDGKRN